MQILLDMQGRYPYVLLAKKQFLINQTMTNPREVIKPVVPADPGSGSGTGAGVLTGKGQAGDLSALCNARRKQAKEKRPPWKRRPKRS